MRIEWTITCSTDFDLEQAIQDYKTFISCNYDEDCAIYNAVEENLLFRNNEYINYEDAIEFSAKALRKALKEG